MSEFSEILTILLSVESPKEYAEHFEKENVVDVAKKVYDAVDSLRKMPKDEAIASALLAKLRLENENNKYTSEQGV